MISNYVRRLQVYDEDFSNLQKISWNFQQQLSLSEGTRLLPAIDITSGWSLKKETFLTCKVWISILTDPCGEINTLWLVLPKKFVKISIVIQIMFSAKIVKMIQFILSLLVQWTLWNPRVRLNSLISNCIFLIRKYFASSVCFFVSVVFFFFKCNNFSARYQKHSHEVKIDSLSISHFWQESTYKVNMICRGTVVFL